MPATKDVKSSARFSRLIEKLQGIGRQTNSWQRVLCVGDKEISKEDGRKWHDLLVNPQKRRDNKRVATGTQPDEAS